MRAPQAPRERPGRTAHMRARVRNSRCGADGQLQLSLACCDSRKTCRTEAELGVGPFGLPACPACRNSFGSEHESMLPPGAVAQGPSQLSLFGPKERRTKG